MKYSLAAFEKDGRRFVEIDQNQERFDGHSLDEYPRIAKEIIKEKFENRVIGIDNKMFVNGAGRSEFAYPSKPITDANIYEAKMRSSAELDNLLDAGTNYRNEADGKDGHVHSDAVGGFDYYDTLFKIGNRYFEGRINIKNVKRGKLFTDVTQIKDVTQAIMSSYGQNPKSQFLRTSSIDSISSTNENVNSQSSADADYQERYKPYRVDLSQYGSQEQAIYKRHMDSGMVNNRKATHEFVDLLVKLETEKGVHFDLSTNKKLAESGFVVEGATVNGVKTGNGILVNINANNALNSVVGHEIMHVFEGTDYEDVIKQVVREFAEAKGIYKSRYDSIAKLYEKVQDADIEGELTADLIGEYLFTDKDFVRNLSTKHRNLFQKIYDEIKYLCKLATANSAEARKLEKVKKTFAEMYRDVDVKNTAQKDGGMKYKLYSKPNFTKEEWAIVNRRKHSEFDNPKFDLDENQKWMYANEKGHTVFAVYSKADPDDPTVLYGSRGKQAEVDYSRLNRFFEEGKNYAAHSRTTFDRILNDIKSTKGDTGDGIPPLGQRRTTNGDVFLPVRESGGNRTGDSGDVTEDFRQEAVTEYDEEASENSDASSITFSNDYATIRNFMKDEYEKNDSRIPENATEKNVSYSISGSKQAVAPAGGYRITGEDIALAPTREDITRMEQDTESNKPYSYGWFTAKPDMTVTTLDAEVPESRADVVSKAKENAAKVGKISPKDGSVSVYVDDVDTDVLLSTGGLRHGLDRRFDTLAPVTLKAGEILRNSIRVNEMTPKNKQAKGSYVLIGTAKNADGELYIVQSVVNQFSNELESMDVLYAINAKTEPNLGKKKNRLGAYPQGSLPNSNFLSDSTISISELLDYVNKYFPDVLPEDVLKHYGHDSRPNGALAGDVLYSLSDDSVAEEIGAPTREDIAQMEQERFATATLTVDDAGEEFGAPTREDIMRMEAEKELHGPWRMTDALDQRVEKLYRMMLREEVSEEDYIAQLVKADRQYQQRGSKVEEALERVREAYRKETTETPETEKKMERLTRKVLHKGGVCREYKSPSRINGWGSLCSYSFSFCSLSFLPTSLRISTEGAGILPR